MQSNTLLAGLRKTSKNRVFFLVVCSLICSLIAVDAAQADEVNINSLEREGPISSKIQNFKGIRNFKDLGDGTNSFRVKFPAGSYDPMSMQQRSLQYGGMNFRYKPDGFYKESCSIVQYYVRFPNDFDFVKGGKLPGLFGGEGNTGGKIPNGSDGFSVRILWTKDGKGQIYAYLPSSKKWGTGLAKNSWTFSRGQWNKITMLVQLNSPNHPDGKIRLRIDDKKVAELDNIVFRNNEGLLINGLLFSTFFGGNNSSFAPKTDQYIDFKNVIISKNISPEMRCSDD